jgi:menaquinone-dependent protoporphyrinogen IX oxidase
VTDLAPYSAVVVGAPMILGWHKAAVKFIKKHKSALSQVPVAYFITCKSLTELDEVSFEATKVCVDPELAKPPKNPSRLSFRENYSTVQNYLWPVFRAAPEVKPVSAAFFGGILNMGNMKWYQMLFVLLIVQAPAGGHHNMEFIRQWAGKLREEMLGVKAG